MNSEYLNSTQLEELTGTPASTWRYWAGIGSGPISFKLGRRRVWKRSAVMAWLDGLEKTGITTGSSPGASQPTASA